ncbi:MAG: hypothetical protein IKA76_03375 [Clostridia bacterium]|nr:hypothetical protein [Clostridia bacterium]
MNLKSIMSLVMLGLALIFVGVGVLKNRKNHWIYAATRVAVVILSMVIGVLISNLLGGALASLLWSLISDGLVDRDMAEAMDALPSLETVFIGLVASVIALLLFVAVFLIVKAILNAIAKPIARKIIVSKDLKHTAANDTFGQADPKALQGRSKRIFKKKALRTSNANVFGMVGGAIGCLLIWVALFAPLVGVSGVFYEGVALLQNTEDVDEDMEIVVEIADAAANNVGSKIVSFFGGKPVADGLISFNMDGHSVNIRQELRFVGVASDAFLYMDEEDMEKETAAEKLRNMSKEFSKTDLLPVLIPEFCHAACDEWEKGREFIGMSKPTMDGDDALLDPVLNMMAVSTYDTVKEDVGTIVELIAEAVENDAIERIEKDPIHLFSDTEFSSSMMETLLNNDRLDTMIGSFLQLGVESVGEEFGMYRSNSFYDHFVGAMYSATVPMQYNPNAEALAERYEKIFDEYGLEVHEGSALAVANHVNAALESGMTLTRGTMSAILSTAKIIGEDQVEFSLNAKTVGEHSALVFIDQMSFDSHTITDTAKEADALAAALAAVAEMVEDMDSDEFSPSDSIQSLGKVMDLLAKTETVGAKNVENLVIGLIQSENFHDSMGLSVMEATDIAESIVEGAKKQSYQVLMSSIGETIRVLNAVNDSDKPLDETVKMLMSSLDANSAKVLQSMAKPSVMIANGVPEENAEASADLLSDMFGNLADMGEDMTREDFEREAEAVTNLTNLAMNAALNSDGATFGEDGALGVSEEDFINQVLDSNVVSKTMRDTVYADGNESPAVDPLNSGIELSEEEEANVLGCLNDRWANENADDEEARQNYLALGAMINMELDITDSGIQRAQ